MPLLADELSRWIASCLVLGLRIAPIFVFAPPFTLTRVPRLFLVLLGLGIAVALLSSDPRRMLPTITTGTLVQAAVCELLLGGFFVLVMQLCFAALYLAGRTVDIQAGFGLATLIDPNSHVQTPLVGSLFAYVAGALFFSVDGHVELLRILAASLDAVPLGGWIVPVSLGRLTEFMSAVFVMGMGVAGAAILVMILIDMVIALLARTVPQMNVLILGFQVKTIALLMVLPLCFGVGSALMLRMLRLTLEALPGLY